MGDMEVPVLTKEQVGARVARVRRLSLLSGREIAARLDSRDEGLLTRMERGEARVLERVAEIANATAGEGDLADASPIEVFDYLMGRRPDLPLAWDDNVSNPSVARQGSRIARRPRHIDLTTA